MVEPMRFELDSLACFLLRKNPLVSPLRGNLLRKLSSTTSRFAGLVVTSFVLASRLHAKKRNPNGLRFLNGGADEVRTHDL